MWGWKEICRISSPEPELAGSSTSLPERNKEKETETGMSRETETEKEKGRDEEKESETELKKQRQKRERAGWVLCSGIYMKIVPSSPTLCPGLAPIPTSATNSLENNLTS